MWDWLDELIGLVGDSGDAVDLGTTAVDLGSDLGEMGDFGGDATEWFLDRATGELVTAAEAQDLLAQDYDFGDLPLSDSPVSTSTSDILRSLEGNPWAPGSEDFAVDAMADPTASIASTGGTDWGKLLSKGLKGLQSGLSTALGAAGSGAGALGAGGRSKGVDLPSALSMMGAPTASVSAPDGRMLAPGGVAGVAPAGVAGVGTDGLGGLNALLARIQDPGGVSGGGSGVLGMQGGGGGVLGMQGGGFSTPLAADAGAGVSGGELGMQGGINAILSRLQADPGASVALQAPIDPGPVPMLPFTPLVLPAPSGAAPTAPPPPRMSGLQRLMLERLG